MAEPNETYRRYHSGRYKASGGEPGEATFKEGSSYGYYTPENLAIKDAKKEINTEEGVDLTATKAMRKMFGVTKTGERGQLGGLRTKKALEED